MGNPIRLTVAQPSFAAWFVWMSGTIFTAMRHTVVTNWAEAINPYPVVDAEGEARIAFLTTIFGRYRRMANTFPGTF